MRKALFILLAAASTIFGRTQAEDKPVLIFGYGPERTTICKKILFPNGIVHVNSPEWVHPKEYGKYSLVIHAGSEKGKKHSWAAPDEIEALKKYVEDGGTVIVCGGALYNLSKTKRSLKPLEGLLGFQGYERFDSKESAVTVFTPAGKKWFADVPFTAGEWKWNSGVTPTKVTSAEVLAEHRLGSKSRPAVLVKQIGKGKIYTLNPSPFGVARYIKVTGIADDKGNFILTEDGKRLDALIKLTHALVMSAGNVKIELTEEQKSWGRVPLGEPGTLVIPATSTKPAEFKKPAELKKAAVLAEYGVPKSVIVYHNKQQYQLACILKYHLDKMSGAKFLMTKQKPAAGHYIEIADQPKLEPETVIVKSDKDHVLISGAPDGLKMAMVYFLEKLGCRCLWPGELGKVIPKKPMLHAPEIDLNTRPVLVNRRIRMGGSPRPGERTPWGLKTVGVTDENQIREWCKRYHQHYLDAGGKLSVGVWNGLGSRTNFSWGHAFGYFWPKYGKTHPEYFALQSYGSRSQASAPDRARLCHGNPEVAEVIGSEIIEYFKKKPNAPSKSICLNDGGGTSFCMCEKCRKLDPANSPRRKNGGYSLTDRVLDFSNRIAQKVTSVYPDKLLSIYIYSAYQDLPVKVKPHPSLILCLTAYSYTNEAARQKYRKEYAQWSSFGNKLFFRPNALAGFGNILAPQNYARKMFNDLEFFKANGLAGTDYDCCDQNWACKGLVFYALLRAHWNPDRLDYDAVFDDYCRTGFGPAAEPVKAYFTKLEELTDQAAAQGKPYLEFFNEKTAAELRAMLDEAAKKAADDPVVLKRVEFLKLGLTVGDYSIAMQKALDAKDRKKFLAVREEARKWIRGIMYESPTPYALTPSGYYRNSHLAAR
ncbi:MAG: DUF4838 domain-containing protein [Lentisphaeria bacterium]|nr:DUF4838 domain-containing protein [Lentisphaeria bacterium]